MAKTDHAGRPIVVVTGMGIITSLGAGREDNWRKLTAGESGIREITRISTEGLKTRIAGTIDFIPVEHHSSPALSERLAEMAAEEAIAQSNIGSRGDFPGPLFIAVAPIEIEWEQREELVRASGANGDLGYADLMRAGETRKLPPYLRTIPVRLGRGKHCRALRHQRLADLACRQLARPAPPRSSSASRRSGAARRAPPSASALTPR